MRFNDTVTAFPSILLALVLISLLGPGKYNVILALGVLFIPSFARIVRGEFAKTKNLDYITNAKLMGAKDLRIMLLHILPNISATLLSSLAIGFNNAVLAEAGMSYLGIGVQPPEPSLGKMLAESQAYLFNSPWYAIFTGFVIVLMILGFSLLGDGLKSRR
jgi:peptide/nickel transport system permease protein